MKNKIVKKSPVLSDIYSSSGFTAAHADSAGAAVYGEDVLHKIHHILEMAAYNPHLHDPVVPSNEAVVRVESGEIRGSIQNGICQYLGVPYAEAHERFVKAGPAAPWKGVRDAVKYGPVSPQYVVCTNQPLTWIAASNSCQNLNIWTPTLDRNAKKPVMVWLHGGGFISGSGNAPWYNGENLSRRGDVVVVTVNHRLNVLGHLDLSAYGAKYKDSANVGSMDMVDALQWIHANIARFGGDPNNVTLFGQSGGGSKVLELMAAPSAKGLFQKAIVESGTTGTAGVRFTPAAVSREFTAETLKNLNLDPRRIEDLQTMRWEKIMAASDKALLTVADRHKIPNPLGMGCSAYLQPVSGTDFLPRDPVQKQGFAPEGKDIPLLIGTNLNEAATIFPTAAHPNMTERQKELYAKAYPNQDPNGVCLVDTLYRPSTLEVMNHKADQNGAPVYAYVFTKQVGKEGAFHTAEIPFVFSNTAEETPFSDEMTALWVSFARTGVPTATGVPEWKPYTRENGCTMILDDKTYLARHHDKALLKSLLPDDPLWDE